jgi:hypothetical protein
MAQIIKVSGEIVEIKPENGKELSLEQLQGSVEGYIELVPMMNPMYGDKVMFCNEDGIRLNKSFNPNASNIAGQRILGNAILCDKWEVS